MDASRLIDKEIKSLGDWRGKTLAAIRRIVHEAVPDVMEEWKWMGTPTWSRNGILCIANAHKNWVKLTFSKGAMLPDPEKIFNAGLEGNAWRAINFFEGDRINERALKNLFLATLALNNAKSEGAKPAKGEPRSAKSRSKQANQKKTL